MNTGSVSLKQKAIQADKTDNLALMRERFDLPENVIYLDGNSLGPLPKSCKQRAQEVIDKQWGTDLISSWNKHQWIDLPQTVGEKIAPLIGAAEGQTICCDSISINLFKVLSAALDMQQGRNIVLSQGDNFPTDLYMVQGLSSLVGEHRCELKQVEEDKLLDAMNNNVAVLLLTHVNFRSGQIHDMKKLTELAHQKGILVIWDLAHSAGALELAVDECDIDFAVGCTYKYLNGGPGAPGFVYVSKKHQHRFKQPLYGWMGHATPFTFDAQYQPSESIAQCLTGTPPILSMSILDAALTVFENIDMASIRKKSIALTEFFISCLQEHELESCLPLFSPANCQQRGSQISLSNDNAYAICQVLIEQGVIADFRAPNILRFGFTPLYTRYIDVFDAANILAEVMTHKRYTHEKYNKQCKVT